MKKILLTLIATVATLTACNDADYKIIENGAYINESLSAKSAKVIITDEGGFTEITPCLSSAAPKDCKFRLEVDEKVLEEYNEKQSTGFVTLPEGQYEIPNEIIIKKGEYTADPVKVNIKPLTEDMIGETYALPLRLVSEDGAVLSMPQTSAFVITTEAITTSSLPQFNGGPMLKSEMPKGPETYNEYTIEVKFQVSNTYDRDRAVFVNRGDLTNFVLLRFEDPQRYDGNHEAHSLVQIVGRNRLYMNPSFSFVPNKWQHLALTCDGSQYKLYINGAFAGVKDIPSGPTTFEAFEWFTKGDDSWSHWGNCTILMAEARVWSVCRTEAQIQNNMATVSAKSKGLEAYWRMNDGTGNTFADCTGNGHTLTSGNASTPKWIEGVKSTDESTPWK
ncbi:DUF1735 and LamG domain-containing protein [uncultured Prevotella sp.]|uniref:DUF1735 and LamG domain-containing protein n=1 Tax=uncultured Prevotella sp. TaxID=159272 RepID=UPI00262D0FCD|nr:DUF1735 and LamG domain-containing protein [uncultured Prevotella sp.]